MRAEVVEAIEELQRNQSGAVERALTLLQNTVFSFSLRVCGHREDAEDTMQETLLKTAAALPNFTDAKALGVWLYKVAKTRCLMSRRRSKYAPKEQLSLETLMPDRAELERLAPTWSELARAEANHPEGALLANEAEERIKNAVLRLPPDYRLVLVLHDMEELSTAEIAQALGLREGTVRVRLHRARLFVRNALAGVATRRVSQRKKPTPRPGRCKALFAELSEYIDGELPAADCDELEKHLGGCAPCQAFLKSLETTVEALRRQKAEGLAPEAAALATKDLVEELERLVPRKSQER
jgi:RNA polymerase sigma-70 factor (ECF subfamily)